MTWDSVELGAARLIAASLEVAGESAAPRPANGRVRLAAADSSDLVEGLREVRKGHPEKLLPVRHIYRLLGFDETHPFRWRLDHKLVQALLLQHYCPGAMPSSVGLSSFLQSQAADDGEDINRLLQPHHVKAAVGSGAPSDNAAERERLLRAVPSASSGELLEQESWIVQEKLNIETEYRVHTVERKVVSTLTYDRHSWSAAPEGRTQANHFVQSLADSLPPAFLAQSICGWDVCRTSDDRFLVIEINFGGMHSGAEQGFQASGFFAGVWGPLNIARLVRFVEADYGITVDCVRDDGDPSHRGQLYNWISRWHALLDLASRIEELGHDAAVLEDPLPPLSGQDDFREARQLYQSVAKRLDRVAALMRPGD